MTTRDHPHDKLFKQALSNPKDAALELRAVLPEALAARIDFDSLIPKTESFIDDAFKGAYADLLYTVRYANRDALIYILFEHKSRPHRFTLLQLLRYMVRIWEKCLTEKPSPSTLPPIIPAIVFHSDKGHPPPTHFHALFDPALMSDPDLAQLTPAFEARLDDLSRLRDEALRARAMGPEATLGFVFLRDARRRGRILDELAKWADQFGFLNATLEGQRAILQLFSYLLIVAPNLDFEELTRRVHQAIPETENLVMTLAEKLIKQGRQEGRQEGYRTLVRRQIELKFGTLGPDALTQLDAADEATLIRYSERVLTAMSVEGVLGE
jgi:predicted transposase YdaD